MKIIITAIALYLMIGIFTFGHAWNHTTDRQRKMGNEPIIGFVGFIAWPFYWSMYLQEPKTSKEE